MAGKSDKLYSKSPKLGRDGDGKMGISKPTQADAENMGTAGNPLPGDGEGEMPVNVEEMHGRHETEMKDMHKRHEEEHKDMHKRHLKEHKKLSGKE